MKKRERIKKEGNVILFPDLDKRLVEKGLDKLKQKNFSAAIELLNEASQLNPDNEDVFIGLVLAYFEAGNYKEANKLAKKMLQTGIGDYFQIVDMYIMILVQQHEYAEIAMTIEALLEEKEVPPEKIEHFMKMLQFSRKMADSVQEQREPDKIDHNQKTELKFDLFSIIDPGEQVQLAGRLASSNVRAYIEELADYLASDAGDPFFKTILLTVLKEQDYDKQILVKKFSRQVEITPNLLFEVHSHPDYQACVQIVEAELENEDPILLDSIKQLMERYFFLLYPFTTEIGSAKEWSAAFHFIASAYFGQEKEMDQVVELYGAKDSEVRDAVDLIARIEENSSF